MTREEAIERLERWRDSAVKRVEEFESLFRGQISSWRGDVVCFDMAIAALRERDALLAEIKGMCHLCRHYNHGIGYKPCDNCDGGNNFEWRGAQAVTDGHQLETVTNRNGLNGWISVEDEKPKRRGRYFIAYKFAGSDMHFYGEAIWHDDIPDNGYVRGDHFSNEGVDGMYVTHWMEIPKLPESPKGE